MGTTLSDAPNIRGNIFKNTNVNNWGGSAVGNRAACVLARLKRRRAWVQIAVATLSGNSLRQTVHTHRAYVHQAAKSVAALLRIAGGNCRPGGK